MKSKSSWLMCSSVVCTIKKIGCYNINIQAGSFYLESTGSALNQSWAKLSETGQARNHKCGWCGGIEYDNSKGIWVPLTPDSLRTAAFAQYWFLFSLTFPVFLSLCLAHNVVCVPLGWLVSLPNCLKKRGSLTSSNRALAFSWGSRRKPAVAFRTTGVCIHSSLGIVFFATFSSCLRVSPPSKCKICTYNCKYTTVPQRELKGTILALSCNNNMIYKQLNWHLVCPPATRSFNGEQNN